MEWYYNNLERERKRRRDYSREYRQIFPERRLLQTAKARAKRKGLSFTLSESDISIPERCPILGTEFQKHTLYAASLDRIDSAMGYSPANTWVISLKANVMKSNATKEELINFAKWILKTYRH